MNAEETRVWVASLPCYSFNEAVGAMKADGCGVYLIYEGEQLLYVGESTNINNRLGYHSGKESSGNLFWHLADDADGDDAGHHCACGKFIACSLGNRWKPSMRRISGRFDGFLVRVALFDDRPEERFSYEGDCQRHLHPVYPKLGMTVRR